jgi:hypothetical protein
MTTPMFRPRQPLTRRFPPRLATRNSVMRFPWPVAFISLILSAVLWNSAAVGSDYGCEKQTQRCYHHSAMCECSAVCSGQPVGFHSPGHHRVRAWGVLPTAPPTGMVVQSTPVMQVAPFAYAATPMTYAAVPTATFPPVAAAPVLASPFLPAAPLSFPAPSPVAMPQAMAFPALVNRSADATLSITPAELRAVADILQATRAPVSTSPPGTAAKTTVAAPLSAPQPPADTGLEDRIKKLEGNVDRLSEISDKLGRLIAEHDRRLNALERN